MTAIDLNRLIREHQAADMQPDIPMMAPGLIIIALSIISWAVLLGVGYCLWMAGKALAV